MTETCEKWLDLVNNSVYYARQTREIYQVLPYAVYLVRQYLVNESYLE